MKLLLYLSYAFLLTLAKTTGLLLTNAALLLTCHTMSIIALRLCVLTLARYNNGDSSASFFEGMLLGFLTCSMIFMEVLICLYGR
jgi:hypothetical protein